MRKRVLVTGASRGIGFAIAKALAENDYEVIGTSRNPDVVPSAVRTSNVRYLPLDTTSDESISSLVQRVGPLDILINNAGVSQTGPVEETRIDRVRHFFELNFIGAVQLIQSFLPEMRKRRQGLIINIGSIAARMPLPYSTIYAATKSALEALSQGLRNEVKMFGIRVVMLAPFSIHTTIKQEKHLREGSPYADKVAWVNRIREKSIAHARSPEIVARKVLKIVRSRHPKSYYVVGKGASLISAMLKFTPEFLREEIVKRKFRLY